MALAMVAANLVPALALGHSHRKPPVPPGKGTLSVYTCGKDPTSTVSFSNISGQLYITGTVEPLVPGCDAIGGDWEGLNNTAFQSFSFDVQATPPCSNNDAFGIYVILEGTDANGKTVNPGFEFFGCKQLSSGVDLGNGFTRYTINQGATSNSGPPGVVTPAKITGIIVNQTVPFPTAARSVVFGNFTLNGNIKSVKSTTPIPCPPNTFDAPGTGGC
jgi:hypothetical protein